MKDFRPLSSFEACRGKILTRNTNPLAFMLVSTCPCLLQPAVYLGEI